ncbi:MULTISPECIES: YbaY family lipoprotein [Falsihalocynthiibacter]|uniref:YbaY family lipoprotein n=1 Tax=Falsihalocynthiibacter TaxID=2854182 RepID=UPI00300201AC
MDYPFKTFSLACATVALSTFAATAGTVSGTVTYLERIALPPEATLTVRLLDVSRADAPSMELSTKVYALNGVPQPFSLDYDDNMIDPRFTYSVDAEIEHMDEVLFRSTSAYLVITRDAPSEVEIVVQKIPAPRATLEDTSWVVTSIGGNVIVADRVPMVEFAQNGAFAIQTTCNNLGGEAEIGEGTITFPTNMPTTMMACEDPYMRFQGDITEALLQVTGYTLSDATLTFTNEAGIEVMEMQESK